MLSGKFKVKQPVVVKATNEVGFIAREQMRVDKQTNEWYQKVWVLIEGESVSRVFKGDELERYAG